MLSSGLTKFLKMAKENLSSKSEEQLKSLEKKVENLQKILELQQKTRDHDKKFGKYEMM